MSLIKSPFCIPIKDLSRLFPGTVNDQARALGDIKRQFTIATMNGMKKELRLRMVMIMINTAMIMTVNNCT